MNGEGPNIPSPPSATEPHGVSVPRHRRLLAGVAAAIFLVGTAASGLGALAWSSYARSQSTRTFSSAATTSAAALSIALQRDADLTATARTLVLTTPSLTNARFASWFQLLGTRNSYPGSFALMFIDSVHESRLHAFSDRVANDPPLGFPMTGPFRVSPPGARPPYCLTRAGWVQLSPSMGLSITSLSGLLAFTAPDLDYCDMPIGKLLRQSATTGEPAAATLASLLADVPHAPGMPTLPHTPVGFLTRNGLIATLSPIYAGGPVPPAPSERLSALTGWIFAIYQANSILDPLVQGHRGASATLSYINPSGARIVLASTGASAPNALKRSFKLAATGNWIVTLSAPASVSGLSATAQGVAVLLGGLVMSLLLCLLVSVLSRSRAKALQLVEERTVQLRHQALHDGLTALPNRDLIFDRAEQMLARSRRDGTGVAALFVDLDQFKDINDTFGHGAGDQLLCEASRRFATALRDTDTVGRLGGDEFVVLVESPLGSLEPEKVAGKLIAALQEPFHLGAGGRVPRTVSASIGIAVGARNSAEELLRDADIALYEAKEVARGAYVVFHPEMHAAIETRLGLEAELREALANDQFFLVYQPIFVLSDQTMTGAEALLRWRHPARGVVMPNDFIPTLEATGMILEVGRFVLEEACRRAAGWAQLGHEMMISVNVSGCQLDREDFVSVVEQAVLSSGLEPRLLTIEITETTLMQNTALSARRLRALKEVGVNVAIDDFGTGYCSLAYLQQFPVDSLKIDRSFVSQMTSSAEGGALIHTIVQMGKDLNLKTLAEGIETPEQLARLRLEECVNGQGYLFARPLEASAIGEMIAATPELAKETR